MKYIKIGALFLALCLLMTGCVAKAPVTVPADISVSMAEEVAAEMQPGKEEEEELPEKSGFIAKPWIPASLFGALDGVAQPDKKEDFYASANYEWITTHEIGPGEAKVNTFTENDDVIRERLQTLIKKADDSDHDSALIHSFYSLLTDYASRNSQGIEALRPYVQQVENIGSINQMNDFLKSNKTLGTNFLLFSFAAERQTANSSRYNLVIYPTKLLLEAADEYNSETQTPLGQRMDEANRLLIGGILQRLGYTQAEATDVYEKAIEFETKLAKHMLPRNVVNSYAYSTENNTSVTGRYLTEEIDRFPIINTLFTVGVTDFVSAVVREPEWLEALNEEYTLENLEGIRDYTLCWMVKKTARYLDEDALALCAKYDAIVNGTDGSLDLDNAAYEAMQSYLGEEMGKIYVMNYVTEETKEDIRSMIGQVIEVYRTMLQQQSWLSPETIEKALLKLNTMETYVGEPGSWSNNLGLNLNNCESLMKAIELLEDFDTRSMAYRFVLGPQKGCWGELGQYPQNVNACYVPDENSINVFAGVMFGGFYDPQGSFEHNLAGIGAVIGHEISHAFDNTGALYDENGNMNNWWTEEDKAAFDQKTERVVAYLNAIEPLENVTLDGKLQAAELIADMGSMSVLLNIAKNTENFNYEEFFSSFAALWGECAAPEYFEQRLSNPHPPKYVRVNAVVQQFDAFYETYGVSEGDGMYLAPADRIAIW